MSSYTILSIDDDPMVHKLLEFYLGPDVKLWHETCPYDGLQAAEERQPDLILLDVDMPGLNGFEVCRSLKANPVTSEIPVLFLTSERGHSNSAHGLEAGAADYIAKPVTETELRRRVHRALPMR